MAKYSIQVAKECSKSSGHSFKQWCSQVNDVMLAMVGLGKDDIADKAWYDMYDSGESAYEAAKSAIEEEAESMGLDMEDLL